MKSTIVCLKVLLLLSTVMLTACQTDDLPPIPQQAQTGRIVLSLSEVQLYTEVTTRADGNIADYTYTLTNTETSEASTITFTDGSAIVPAGTYTLTATSKTAQDAAPWYQGTSGSFSLFLGGTQTVEIELGKPKNVEIVVSFDESFTNLYENCSVTIGRKSVSANGNLYAMPDELGKVTYTIKGSAKAGSYVSDIPASGITGTINNAEAGISYPLNITASSISDLLIQIGEGTHNGEFDTKEYRPLN